MDSQQNGSALVELAQVPIGHDDCLQNRETVYRRRQTQAPGLKSSAVASPPPIADIVDTRPEGAGTAPLLQSMTTTTAAGPLPLIQYCFRTYGGAGTARLAGSAVLDTYKELLFRPLRG